MSVFDNRYKSGYITSPLPLQMFEFNRNEQYHPLIGVKTYLDVLKPFPRGDVTRIVNIVDKGHYLFARPYIETDIGTGEKYDVREFNQENNYGGMATIPSFTASYSSYTNDSFHGGRAVHPFSEKYKFTFTSDEADGQLDDLLAPHEISEIIKRDSRWVDIYEKKRLIRQNLGRMYMHILKNYEHFDPIHNAFKIAFRTYMNYKFFLSVGDAYDKIGMPYEDSVTLYLDHRFSLVHNDTMDYFGNDIDNSNLFNGISFPDMQFDFDNEYDGLFCLQSDFLGFDINDIVHKMGYMNYENFDDFVEIVDILFPRDTKHARFEPEISKLYYSQFSYSDIDSVGDKTLGHIYYMDFFIKLLPEVGGYHVLLVPRYANGVVNLLSALSDYEGGTWNFQVVTPLPKVTTCCLAECFSNSN